MKTSTKSLLFLHISIFLWGFTAVLGKLITISAINLVWWRILFTLITLIFIPTLIKSINEIKGIKQIQIIATGCIVALHWFFFYGSIKLGNASMALTCLSTTSLFTSLLEPMVLKKKFQPTNFLLGLLVTPGIILIGAFEVKFLDSIVYGILAAMLSALFGLINKKYVSNFKPMVITALELFGGFVFLSIIIAFIWLLDVKSLGASLSLISVSDLKYLIILALFCTTVPFILSLEALKNVSAFTASISLNLEPVYGILLSAFFLAEY